MTRLHVDSIGTGAPLVLLHGWALHSGLWGELVSRLAPRHELHLVDLPGHGYSVPHNDFDLGGIVEMLDQRFRGLKQPIAVLGWSLGGTVAMEWALTYPERISSLALVGATPCFTTKPDWPHAMTELLLRRFGDELSVAYKLTLQRFLSLQVQGSESGRSTLAELRAHLFKRGSPTAALLRDALDVMDSTDQRPRVADIKARTRIISGDRDTLTPLAAGAWLGEHIASADFRVISGAAHAPFLSHPEAFAAALEGSFDE